MKNVISLTDAAADRIRNIVENAAKPIVGIKIGVRNSGCAGMAYQIDPVEEPNPKDDLVEDKGVKVYIDASAVLFLIGTTMDYQETKLTSGFVFNNPNQTSACGCGESVTLKPADPAVVSH